MSKKLANLNVFIESPTPQQAVAILSFVNQLDLVFHADAVPDEGETADEFDRLYRRAFGIG